MTVCCCVIGHVVVLHRFCWSGCFLCFVFSSSEGSEILSIPVDNVFLRVLYIYIYVVFLCRERVRRHPDTHTHTQIINTHENGKTTRRISTNTPYLYVGSDFGKVPLVMAHKNTFVQPHKKKHQTKEPQNLPVYPQ